MPYILPVNRDQYNESCADIVDQADCAGDLNFAITKILHQYVNKKGLNYATLNEVVGMMESCKAEFYRRVVAPYEDHKAGVNGDVMEVNVPSPNKS